MHGVDALTRMATSAVFLGILPAILPFLFSQPAYAGRVRVILQDIECIKQNEGGMDEIYIKLASGPRSPVYGFHAGSYKTVNRQVFYEQDNVPGGRWDSVELMESDAGETFRGGDDFLGCLEIQAINGRINFKTQKGCKLRNPVMNQRNQTYTVEYTGDDAIYRVTFHYFWD